MQRRGSSTVSGEEKEATVRASLFRGVAVVTALCLLMPAFAFAQVASAVESVEPTGFNAEQLDVMLAPIALYSDTLLVQMLMASTYPLQVVEASRWLEQPANKGLTGDALAAAMEKQVWDPSVKSLVPIPQALAMLNGALDWTQQLGYAFATGQADVMASIQRLRSQAQAAGSLKTTEQQRVVVEKETVIIASASLQIVHAEVNMPRVAPRDTSLTDL